MNDFNDDAAQISLPNELPLAIHKRGSNKNYWMRFSVNGHGQQRFGLGTDDLKPYFKRRTIVSIVSQS